MGAHDPGIASRTPAFARRSLLPAALGRAGRRVLATVCVGLALVGAVVTPPLTMLVLPPIVGGFMGGIVAISDPSFPRSTAARRRVVQTVAAGAVLVPAVSGLGLLGAAGLPVALALVLLGVVLLLDGAVAAGSSGAEFSAADAARLAEVLSRMPTGTLVNRWRATGAVLRSTDDPGERCLAAEVRAVLLDEMARRDPDGVARWLTEGDEDFPDQYISTDPGTGA